jgi:hypothetical protein
MKEIKGRKLRYIGKILLDKEFFKFVMKLPFAIDQYHKMNMSSKNLDIYLRLENKVKLTYKEAYSETRNMFGIKMNYTLRKNH